MMSLQGRILGLCALLIAGAAQAERVSEPYGTAGDWEISTENHHACGMKRMYGSPAPEKEQGLFILYDPQRQLVSLNWGTGKPPVPPLSNTLDLDLAFLKGASLDESWGRQPFQTQKGDGRLFTHIFAGTKDVQRILQDLASHQTIALFLGPSLMMGLHLDASDAVAKLRECASKLPEPAPGSAPGR
jgi:hypothetical protein